MKKHLHENETPIVDCINKRAISMASFKGRLAVITIRKLKDQ